MLERTKIIRTERAETVENIDIETERIEGQTRLRDRKYGKDKQDEKDEKDKKDKKEQKNRKDKKTTRTKKLIRQTE